VVAVTIACLVAIPKLRLDSPGESISTVTLPEPKREEAIGERVGLAARPRRRGDRVKPKHLARPPQRRSRVFKRSITIAGRKTSVTLEDAFWKALKEIATARTIKPADLIARIDKERQYSNLSSAIRLFILDYYRG
jgi:predicted DNA-binding ribbon-helix-helix protein